MPKKFRSKCKSMDEYPQVEQGRTNTVDEV